MLNGSADDLRGRKGLYALPTRGITVWALRIVVCPKALQTSAVLRPDRREVVLSFCCTRGVWICVCFTGQTRTVQERARVMDLDPLAHRIESGGWPLC